MYKISTYKLLDFFSQAMINGRDQRFRHVQSFYTRVTHISSKEEMTTHSLRVGDDIRKYKYMCETANCSS